MAEGIEMELVVGDIVIIDKNSLISRLQAFGLKHYNNGCRDTRAWLAYKRDGLRCKKAKKANRHK